MLSRSQDGALLLGRLFVAALFLPSGLNKILTSSFAASLGAKGVLWPRCTAVVLIGFTAVTLWLTPRHVGVGMVFRPRQNGEVLESLAVIGGLLFYSASGPGSWSRASLRGS